MELNVELKIQHGDTLFTPVIQEGITWTTERQGSPGTLSFKVIKDESLGFQEGDPVSLKVNGHKVFYGFVFKKSRDKDHIISVTAYDQLRYFKNKDTYVYEDKTASEVLKMIIHDHFNKNRYDETKEEVVLSEGEIADTKLKIASRTEENTSLFDMVLNALDITLQNRKEMYVLYDDFGQITLKNIADMKLDVLIDEDTGEKFEYTSSIDDNTYTRVLLKHDNEKSGERDVYMVQDSSNINQWGILQYFDTIQEGENGKAKADALLKLYNSKTRNLSINNALGDIRVRAGSLIPVILYLGDVSVNNYMLVEKCTHNFNGGEHFMTLTLRGGEFIA